jgi:membrane-bound lytic murein transglycosylase B
MAHAAEQLFSSGTRPFMHPIRQLRRAIMLATVCATVTATAARADDGLADFQTWLKALKTEASKQGVSAQTLDTAFRDVAPIDRVIALDRRQPEFTRTFWSYIENRVTPGVVETGRQKLAKHREMLTDVAARHGVPARYLVAFWGMETNYGAHLGSFPVIDSLATLAYDERRAAFFRTQLLHALHIVDDGHIKAANMKGSWAGAMGHMQFLPSTFVKHAVDATGDGRKDIWGTLRDAFASGANYLDSLGWASDERWGREVALPPDFPYAQAKLDVRKPLSAWADMGVKRADGGSLPVVDDMQGSIVLPQGHNGPAFLVYGNFRKILRWNRSVKYAIAVGYLADRIVGLPKIQNGRDVSNAPMARADLITLQERLNTLGFDAGPVDGLPGPKTRAAIRSFQKAAGLPPDGHPSPALLDKLNTYAREQTDSRG